jgi:hypothetical protein
MYRVNGGGDEAYEQGGRKGYYVRSKREERREE